MSWAYLNFHSIKRPELSCSFLACYKLLTQLYSGGRKLGSDLGLCPWDCMVYPVLQYRLERPSLLDLLSEFSDGWLGAISPSGDWANALGRWRSPTSWLVIPGIAVSPEVTHSDRHHHWHRTAVKPQHPPIHQSSYSGFIILVPNMYLCVWISWHYITYVPFMFSSPMGTAICKCLCPTSATWKRKSYVSKLQIVQKITYDKNNYLLSKPFQRRHRDSRHNNAPYLHACNRGWDLWEGLHLDILSRGPRVPSYATASVRLHGTWFRAVHKVARYLYHVWQFTCLLYVGYVSSTVCFLNKSQNCCIFLHYSRCRIVWSRALWNISR